MIWRDRARALAKAAFLEGVAAVDPEAALARSLIKTDLRPAEGGRVYIIAIGKAAVGMARMALAHFHALPIAKALAVTNYENEQALEGCEVIGAAHPVPDAQGALAAEQVCAVLSEAKAADLVLVLVSGGSSALLPAPIDGLTLEDEIALNEMLLASGLEIGDMNLVRQSISRLKGGGMLGYAAPARVVSYVLSDVLGDDLRLVGSGPSIAPVGTVSEARDLLKGKGLWERLSAPLQAALSRPDVAMRAEYEAHLIGSNDLSLRKMAEAAGARIVPEPLVGDVKEAAARVVAEALAAPDLKVIAFGGETTVTLTGNGRGGRNQELALRVALEAKAQGLKGEWVFLSAGTDGRDGPTDAAGGIVDDQTLDRLASVNLRALMENNDSYRALEASGDLLITGPTGTNVADLQLLLRC